MLSAFLLTGAGTTTNIVSGRAHQKKTEPAPVISSPEGARDPDVRDDASRRISRPSGLEMTEPPRVPAPVAPVAAPPPPSPEAEPAHPVPATVPVPGTGVETVWVDDDLPAGAAAEGNWVWDGTNPFSGTRSHGHPAQKGESSHGYASKEPATVPADGMITQEVWLDPADPPKGIALKLKLSTGDEVGVYWEAEEEVFKPGESQELWYYGPLPEMGKWVRLELLAEDMGLEDAVVTGVRFVTYDGRVLWDRTVLTEAPSVEKAQDFLEGPIEVRPNIGANQTSLRSPKGLSSNRG